MAKIMTVEYMCSYCGQKVTKPSTAGKPMPGNCPRKPKNRDGTMKPHSWKINRKF